MKQRACRLGTPQERATASFTGVMGALRCCPTPPPNCQEWPPPKGMPQGMVSGGGGYKGPLTGECDASTLVSAEALGLHGSLASASPPEPGPSGLSHLQVLIWRAP